MRSLFSCLLFALLASSSLADVKPSFNFTELGMPNEIDVSNWLETFLEILQKHIVEVRKITNDTKLDVDWYEEMVLGKPLVSDVPSVAGNSSITACMIEILRESLISWLGTKELLKAKLNEAVALLHEIAKNIFNIPKLFESFRQLNAYLKSLVALPTQLLEVMAKYSKSVLGKLIGCTVNPTTLIPSSEKPSTLEPRTTTPVPKVCV